MGYSRVHRIDIWETYSEMGNSKGSLELMVYLPNAEAGKSLYEKANNSLDR